jgi:hypothetical protein
MTSWSIQALGWAGSALLIFSLLQQRVLRFRLLNLTASCTLVVFNAMLHVWPMVGMNIVTAGINVWMITRLLRERGDESVYEVVAVGPTSPTSSTSPSSTRPTCVSGAAPTSSSAATRPSGRSSCVTRVTGWRRWSSTT